MSAPRAGSRVVIPGGTGLIGDALSAALANAGHDVVVLSRRSPETLRLPTGCRALRWDGKTASGWGAEVDGAQAVVNLAGESIAGGRWSAERKRRILDSRLAAAAAVNEAISAAKVRPRALLQASAVGFYGDRGAEVLDEGSAAGTDFLAETAVAWERASAPVEELGVRRVLLRTGLVLALHGGALAAMSTPFRLGLGARLGSGDQWMPWIHLADEVAAIEFLLRTESARGPFNLCAPSAVTNAEFTRLLARTLSRPAILPAPAFAIRALLGEMAVLVLGGQRARPCRLLDAGFRFRYDTCEPALRELFARGRSAA